MPDALAHPALRLGAAHLPNPYRPLRPPYLVLFHVPNPCPLLHATRSAWLDFGPVSVHFLPALLLMSWLPKEGALNLGAPRVNLPPLLLVGLLLSWSPSANASLAAMARGPSCFLVGCGPAFHAHWLRG